MQTSRISKRIDESPIELGTVRFSKDHGAVLEFLGVVREMEDGRPLEGIRYTCYEPMAWAVLDRTIADAETAFGPHALHFHHRLGFVAVAEPSVIVRVSSGHSAEAFEVCQHYLKAVKTTLPIWKEPVFQFGAEGRRAAS